jgi:hypothetical protein
MRPARIAAALLSSTALLAPLAAHAQQAPAPPASPSYARRSAVNGEEKITGKISSIDSKYRLQVRDDRGFMDRVELHQGTVINPRGLQLQPGMAVTIFGYNRGSVFGANEIDTPYLSYNAAPRSPNVAIGLGFGPVYFH